MNTRILARTQNDEGERVYNVFYVIYVSLQNIGVAKAGYKIMEHIDYLFANDSHPESWNQKKVEDFQNIVYRLCVRESYIFI